ncbi:hypothetical protein Hypma_009731 [Hypsizygus marmoreus]|uniref:Uncharacterized protein n=1 Tax=Hypsizygus marmoreus TaxID=39966 RepID=A0A369JR90_HYPMA|nr:hypothetical protein Hypma_009731 [Hypsizygus marmoreus]
MAFSSPSKRQIHHILPPEVIRDLVSGGAHHELANFALVGTSLEYEAERLLYRAIGFTSAMGPLPCQCLVTLATVPKKAALVKSFSTDNELSFPDTALAHLGTALVKMVSLEGFDLPLEVKSEIIKEELQCIVGGALAPEADRIEFDMPIRLSSRVQNPSCPPSATHGTYCASISSTYTWRAFPMNPFYAPS